MTGKILHFQIRPIHLYRGIDKTNGMQTQNIFTHEKQTSLNVRCICVVNELKKIKMKRNKC